MRFVTAGTMLSTALALSAAWPSIGLAQSEAQKALAGAEIRFLQPSMPQFAALGKFIPEFEKEFGINVVTALQAIVWEGMRLSGVHDKVTGYGRLFREH